MSNHYDDIANLLMRWNVHEGRIGQFDRGLHLLAHLSRGGTLEEYGEPGDYTANGSNAVVGAE